MISMEYPDNIIEMEKETGMKQTEYAKRGIMYGSAVYTDFDLCCDGLLDEFEKDSSVEEALHNCKRQGYDLSLFGYD